MDPSQNPYTPGAGAPPPELAGRDQLLADAEVALNRLRNGLHSQGQLLLGLRGVGKTVLLNRVEEMAEQRGYLVELIEAPEGEGLASLLSPRLRKMLLRMSRTEKAREFVRRAMRALSAFTVSAGVDGIEFGLDLEAGLADSGRLEYDLPDLLLAVGYAARAADMHVILLIDEVQYLGVEDFGALIAALHRVDQKRLPILFFGAGLPLLAGLAGDTKSYAERLFVYPSVGRLPDPAAEQALSGPLAGKGIVYAREAMAHILEQTQGYPYFLQEWGKHAWNVANGRQVTGLDAEEATRLAIAALDASFFKVRLDRLTPKEQEYLRAMASLEAGPHGSSDIAKAMGKEVRQTGALRNGLIKKGMVYSPAYGLTAFTVPMFDQYLRRVMP